MRELATLLSLELRAIFGVNRFLHTRSEKEKRRGILLCVVWAFLLAMAVFYVGALVYGLCTVGLSSIVPAYLAIIASVLILVFGIFTAGHRLFSAKGYDLLASMPVRPGTLVLSRFLALYTEDLLLTLVILLPGALVYGVMARPGLRFYPAALLCTLLIPALPLVLSALLGTLVLAISSRMKHKSLVQTALMLAFVLPVIVLSFSAPGMQEPDAGFLLAMLPDLAGTLGDLIARVYPPAMWVNTALTQGSLAHLALLAAVSLAAMALSLLAVAKSFHAVQRRLMVSTARHDYTLGALAHRSVLRALYIREAKRYFSSSIYVTNTIIGPIMGMIMAIALCVAGVDSIAAALPFAADIPGLVPFAFAAVFCMMPTTSVALSMEGKQIVIVKSLPIPMKALLGAKILLNLSLMLPFYAVSAAAMIIALRPGPVQLLWIIAIPASVIVFSAVLGIAVNLRLHSFDWTKDEAVVKQSLPAMLGGFAPLLLCLLLGGAAYAIPAKYGDAARLAMCALLWIVTARLYHTGNAKKLEDL